MSVNKMIIMSDCLLLLFMRELTPPVVLVVFKRELTAPAFFFFAIDPPKLHYSHVLIIETVEGPLRFLRSTH